MKDVYMEVLVVLQVLRFQLHLHTVACTVVGLPKVDACCIVLSELWFFKDLSVHGRLGVVPSNLKQVWRSLS
jgi:hypothetical protein